MGQYEVIGALGAGAMGEVYRARDATLGRDVALKVLPADRVRDRHWLERFRREAQLLAALNHPNIATIHGLVESDQGMCLVMELVPGERLLDRVRRGPLGIDEALRVGRQIADGLAAAHDGGVIHRDLKPANVLIAADGRVKILDFGLAKAIDGQSSHAASERTHSVLTEPGMVVGTPAYMSPEQARGGIVDRRTDIWALGCVLFELVAGRRAFDGPTASDTIAAVLDREPDWRVLPAATPARLRDLLRRCVQKDVHRRVRDAADVALEIDDMLSSPREDPSGIARPRSPARRLGWVGIVALLSIAAALVGAGLDRWIGRSPATASSVARFTLALPPGERMSIQPCQALAWSPDGARVAFVVIQDNQRLLRIKTLDRFEAQTVAGGEGASDTLFFSPDGQWLVFLAGTELKKVAVTGGAPVPLASTAACGGDWGPDDRLLIGRRDGLIEMSATGGALHRVIGTDVPKGEVAMFTPKWLPGGEAVLFTLVTNQDVQLVAQRLATGERHVLVHDAGFAEYLPPGYLVYSQAGAIFAAPFDLDRLEMRGNGVPVGDGVAQNAAGATPFSLARDSGSLAYAPGGVLKGSGSSLLWVDRRGLTQPIDVPAGSYGAPRLSPDGRRLAVTKGSEAKNDIWIYDFNRTTLTPLTRDGDNRMAVWAPDGKTVAYYSDAAADASLFRRPADGSRAPEPLIRGNNFQVPQSWSPDGKWIAFDQLDQSGQSDVWLLGLDGDRRARPFVQSRFKERSARFSPDGAWLAYESNESGRPEIYVQSFPDRGGRVQLSVNGGSSPVWATSGRELFYRRGAAVMAVAITMQPVFKAGVPRELFAGEYQGGFDVSLDGQRFLMIKPGGPPPPVTSLNLAIDWFTGVRQRLSERR